MPTGLTFAERAIAFYENLSEPAGLPTGVSVMNPYREPEVRAIGRTFYQTYFQDSNPRLFMLGINPGRFGAGVTGISFTTPQNLRRYCGIDNDLPPTPELSSRFIYELVEAFGGASSFYGHFYLTSLYPLALVKAGKNYNYYDDKATTQALWPAISASVEQQLEFGGRRDVAVCLGQKNGQFLSRLNHEKGFFERVIILDHPRYILQYKAKQLNAYIDQYIRVLASAISL